ncbi:28872_t:CDS:2, partial [Gigaspora margarita]
YAQTIDSSKSILYHQTNKKLKEMDQLLVPFSMFENLYRDNEHVGNSELSLEKLETVEKFEIELIKNRTRSIDIVLELIDKFQKIRDIGVNNLVFYTDSSLKKKDLMKQIKLLAHYGFLSTSTEKKHLYKNNVRPCIGPGSESSEVLINTGNQQGSRNENSTLALKQ